VLSSEFAGLEGLRHLVFGYFAVVVGIRHLDALPTLRADFGCGEIAVIVLVGFLEAVAGLAPSLSRAFECLLQFFPRDLVVIVHIGDLDMLPAFGADFSCGEIAVIVLVRVLEVTGAIVSAAASEGNGGDANGKTDNGGGENLDGLGGHGLSLPSVVWFLRQLRTRRVEAHGGQCKA